MSIEQNLKTLAENSNRIANALEAIAAQGDMKGYTPAAAPAAAPAAPAAAPAAPAAPAAAPAAPAAAPAAPAAAPDGALTDEAMNAEMVAEFTRLGGREQIDIEMVKLGITGVGGLTADVQNTLLTAIRAIPNG